ncbi:unnamed protein product [Brachionus calyciflorus]|uniref:Uncharacterized protein n=1 Tax=Brachionus calyciflorus TaxID=104777 RepID=A0A813MFX1_9BILA|nr:unnamed protein product [Brachionus calyciflorus]
MSRETIEETLVDTLNKFGGQTNLIGIKSLSESTKSLSSNSSSKSSLSTRMFSKNYNLQNDTPRSLTSSNMPYQYELIICQLCKNKLKEPKLLNCLHVYCKMCLATQLYDNSNIIKCFKCKQDTMVNPSYGVDSLEDDYVMHNILDMIAIEEKLLDCTSCTTDQKSVARCSDCAQFLCPNCVSAHQFMRCFDNHQVVKFDEIKSIYQANLNRLVSLGHDENKSPSSSSPGSSKSTSSASSSSSKINDDHDNNFNLRHSKFLIDCGVPIHKPLTCKQHPRESLKFFCNTCQIPICSDCVVTSHQQPVHSYERISDAEARNIEELDFYIKKARENINYCQSEYQTLDQYLNELNEQSESSKVLIEETFKVYRQVLEKRKDELLKELEDKHANKHLALMEMNSSIDQSINRLLDVIKFSERVLKNGNTFEILLLKKSIINQIKYLTNTMPQLDSFDMALKFVSNEHLFVKSVQETFGRFYTQKELKQNYLNNLQNSSSMNQIHQDHHQQKSLDQENAWFGSQLEQLQNQLKSVQFDENLIKNLNQLSSLNGQNGSPISPSEDWGSSMVNKISLNPNFEDFQKTHLMNNINSLSPKTLNQLTMTSKQLILNASPFEAGIQMMNPQSSSRSHTPGNPFKQDIQLNGLNSIGSGSSLGSSAGSSNININSNTVINALDEYLPFQNACLTSNMAQNLNQLSKYISPNHQINDLNALNNLNELAGLNMNNYDANSNSSQSPPMLNGGAAMGAIGSGMVLSALNTSSTTQTTFSGNGNLNPPVRQNGKMTNMQIRTKFGTLGSGKAQFNSPHGFCLGVDEEIIVADTNNHRIQIFDKDGEFKYAFGSPGREEGQLWYPRKVAVMRDSGKFVVCDRGNERSRMQIFSKNGLFIKKISIRYIDIVAGLAITQNGEIVAVDSVSPTVFRISESGDLKKWFDCSEYMREPSDIAIFGNEYYVCDFKGHCVAVFNEDGNFVRKIGGENVTNFPNGIDVSDAGDVLVGDSHGNRFHVAVFSRDGTMISEFECPYVKVSRCCGLKITSEGYVVTLAKNNHHVLVLNTLYVS